MPTKRDLLYPKPSLSFSATGPPSDHTSRPVTTGRINIVYVFHARCVCLATPRWDVSCLHFFTKKITCCQANEQPWKIVVFQTFYGALVWENIALTTCRYDHKNLDSNAQIERLELAFDCGNIFTVIFLKRRNFLCRSLKCLPLISWG